MANTDNWTEDGRKLYVGIVNGKPYLEHMEDIIGGARCIQVFRSKAAAEKRFVEIAEVALAFRSLD